MLSKLKKVVPWPIQIMAWKLNIDLRSLFKSSVEISGAKCRVHRNYGYHVRDALLQGNYEKPELRKL